MTRILYTCAFLLLTSLVYAQKSTLLQNVNVRATELKHSLNKTGDSLILEGERTIYKVEIFNKDFEHSLIVKDSKVIIPLHNIPVGRFVVEAALPDRLIVITLLRNEFIKPAINTSRPKRKVSLFGEPALASIETQSTPETEESKPKLALVNTKEIVTDETLTVANKKGAITAKKISLFDNDVATNDTKLTVADIKTTAIDKKLTVADNKAALIDKKITVADNKTTLIDKSITIADNKTALIDKKITVADNKTTLIDKNITIADNKTTLIDKKLTVADNNTAVINKKIALNEKKATVANTEVTVSDKTLISSKNILNNSGKKVVESYWIEYKSNNRQSSSKLTRLGDEEIVSKMIRKINLDKRTKAGKYNELTIWEVYDTTKFLKYKFKRKNDLSSEVDCFNVEPFYKTEKKLINP